MQLLPEAEPERSFQCIVCLGIDTRNHTLENRKERQKKESTNKMCIINQIITVDEAQAHMVTTVTKEKRVRDFYINFSHLHDLIPEILGKVPRERPEAKRFRN